MSQEVPPVAVLVAHRVADWDRFHQVFQDHEQSRRGAGCMGHYVHREADDPNMLYVYCPASDPDRLQTWLGSEDLRGAMANATMVGEPSITVMTPMSFEGPESDEMHAGLIAIHDVEDYDRWRQAYDDFDEFRKSSGIISHAVNQERGNANRVIVYHQARDVDTLRQFADSAELKDAMQRAGVTGEPAIHIVQEVDIAHY